MRMAFSQSLGRGTSNMAEAKAALLGLQWCHSNGYDRIMLECDSKLVIDMLNNTLKPPWHIDSIIKEAQQLIQTHNSVIRHCCRESNNVGDILAKWSHEIHEIMIFNDINLPRQAFGYYKLDKK
uniref:Uncharacterized protein LOC104226268 n=1 Tax=Nicotiana sylvestris TaxID=4096 RepID=A0A1U7W939_NICSY|nr:PREDICTED: uncharacterized protein LOC104226268 [Nicotiana sylvestris]